MTRQSHLPTTSGRRSSPSRFDGGILGDRTRKNLENLLLRIDVDQFVTTYRDEHASGYAEPEFAGHYVDAALASWRATQDSRLVERAGNVVATMVRYQRASGYLGTYLPGLEFDATYSVWNEQFSIMGLLLLHETSGDAAALSAATKCADFIIDGYLHQGQPLFRALNQGIENSCILIEFVHIFEITGEQRYLDFAEWIVSQWEAGSTRLVSATEIPGVPVFATVGSNKAIETLICYRGLLRLGLVTGNERYADAARTYWADLRKWMIGPTGNGSLGELWNRQISGSLEFTNEFHAHENCVAVGWMQLSAELYRATGDADYMDAFEQTLYNHLLGSQAIDGSDFSYYQGNLGAKVHRTGERQYSCCRYRGMAMLAQLGEHVVSHGDDRIDVLLYAASRVTVDVDGVPVQIRQHTEYPRTTTIEIDVEPARPVDFELRLRVPPRSVVSTLTVGSEPVEVERDGGFALIRRTWSPGDRVGLELAFQTERTEATLGDRPAVLTLHGPLTLAIDSREGTPLDATTVAGSDLTPDHPADWSRIARFTTAGSVAGTREAVRLVDYASAGSIDPDVDRFRIWVSTEPPHRRDPLGTPPAAPENEGVPA